MNTVKVIEVVDTQTIRIDHKWVLKQNEGVDYSDDRIKILGLDLPSNDVSLNMLRALLLNKEIQLNNWQVFPPSEENKEFSIGAIVDVDNTPLSYFFPSSKMLNALVH